jgi:hypothetical protein
MIVVFLAFYFVDKNSKNLKEPFNCTDGFIIILYRRRFRRSFAGSCGGRNQPGRFVAGSCGEEISPADSLPEVAGRKSARPIRCRQLWGGNQPGRFVVGSCGEEISRADWLPEVVGKKSARPLFSRKLSATGSAGPTERKPLYGFGFLVKPDEKKRFCFRLRPVFGGGVTKAGGTPQAAEEKTSATPAEATGETPEENPPAFNFFNQDMLSRFSTFAFWLFSTRSARGIVAESPQRAKRARTCSGKPDPPCGGRAHIKWRMENGEWRICKWIRRFLLFVRFIFILHSPFPIPLRVGRAQMKDFSLFVRLISLSLRDLMVRQDKQYD